MKKKLINWGKALVLPVGVYLLFTILTGGAFGTPKGMLAIVRTSIVPILLGMSLSFGMSMGMWNFAAGAIVYSTAIFAADIAQALGWSIPGILLLSIIIATASTAFMGWIYNVVRVPCMVLSLGFAMIFESLPNFLTNDFTGKISIAQSYLAGMPWCVLIAGGMFVIFYIINNRTTLGADIQAIGANIAIANNAGVNIDRVKFLSFLLSGVFLGVTSVMFLSINVSVVAVTGFTSVSMIFDSMMGIFVAAVLAKYVNYSTAVVLGIFTIRMLGTAMVAFGMSSQVRGVMTGVFLLVVLVYSANAGLIDNIRSQKKIAAEANAAYQQTGNAN
ncbi:MAG: hypothetical protein K2O93_09635 [Oscillospiraceae bacterium]|nr:hypothetical protein [Oscillospiraceae bacterium]